MKELFKRIFTKENFKPLINAYDHFLFAPTDSATNAPFIRDYIDLKRLMGIVIWALIPTIIMAIWNSGLQSIVYGSGSWEMMEEYLRATNSFHGYMEFAKKHYIEIISEGIKIFMPLCIISYAVGAFWEILFALIRRHPVGEGFLVTGVLYALILPPTLPYWICAMGISLGIIIGKEIFGGTGMNILNPALISRCFIFFAYPKYMTGDVWVGRDTYSIKKSIDLINSQRPSGVDAISQASDPRILNLPENIKRLHLDAIATHRYDVSTIQSDFILKRFEDYSSLHGIDKPITELSALEFKEFLTGSLEEGGLSLDTGYLDQAYKFFDLKYGVGDLSDANLFFGNRLGSIGETSKLAILLGAIILITTRVGSWRIMLSFVVGMLGTSYLFQLFSSPFSPAQFDFPAYKHLLIGSAAFGLVFMATDPVSAPNNRMAKIVYGLMIGAVVIVIRLINPAYSEGVMLAILLGNVFAPLMDSYFIKRLRKWRSKRILK